MADENTYQQLPLSGPEGAREGSTPPQAPSAPLGRTEGP